jgi:hypothetical protein
MIVKGGVNIFVSSMHRSGSTHIARVLGELLRFRPASMAGMFGEGRETHDINPISSQILIPYGYQIFHMHTPASSGNVVILRDNGIRPVVVIRNIADTLVSIRERILKYGPLLPGVIVIQEFQEWSKDQQYNWLIDNVASWQMQFYVSWCVADVPNFRVRYDTFFKDQTNSTRRLLEWLNLQDDTTDEAIEQATKMTWNKIIGVSGRGKDVIDGHRMATLADNWGVKWRDRMYEDGLL